MIPACRSNDEEYENIKGSLIDCGNARCVFEIKGNSGYVLKEAKPEKYNHNENEAMFYFTSITKNLSAVIECIAEIRSISKSGKYLIMEKLCTELDASLKSGAKAPVEINDPHTKNYGMTPNKKSIKCIDYASWDTTKDISGNVKPVPFQSDQSVSEVRELNAALKKIWD